MYSSSSYVFYYSKKLGTCIECEPQTSANGDSKVLITFFNDVICQQKITDLFQSIFNNVQKILQNLNKYLSQR